MPEERERKKKRKKTKVYRGFGARKFGIPDDHDITCSCNCGRFPFIFKKGNNSDDDEPGGQSATPTSGMGLVAAHKEPRVVK